MSGNFGAILTVLCSSVAGLPVPFAPVHLLFINLLTDSLPAIALVLTVPGFHNLFKVETLNLMQLGCVYLYAFASLLIIQLLKCIRMKLRKRGER